MKAIKLGFVAAVAAIVAVTLVQSFVRPLFPVAPLLEYRKAAPPPDIVRTVVEGDGRLAAGINAWFDDRLGFRPLLTRLANQIDYSLFGYSRKVLMGKDGFLFERREVDELVTHERDQSIEVEKRVFDDLAAYLRTRGIRLVIVATPAKEAFYREFLPDHAPQPPAVRRLDRLRDVLKAGDGKQWLYIDSEAVIRAGRPDKVGLYYRYDLHMTPLGAGLVAQALVNRIAEDEGLTWRWRPRWELHPARVGGWGSGARYLSTFADNDELSDEFSPDKYHGPGHERPGEEFVASPPQPFEVIFRNHGPDARLPPTLLYGTSFLDLPLVLGMYSNFKAVYRVRGAARVDQVLSFIPPDVRYLVFEFWEPHSRAVRLNKIPRE